MRIKITPLSTSDWNFEGEFKVGNAYYLVENHSAGIITELREDDDLMDKEVSWVSRSDIQFVTALRHIQLKGQHLACVALPSRRRGYLFYELKIVSAFPSKDECRQLVYKYCKLATDETCHFHKNIEFTLKDLETRVASFDYNNDLLIRAGSCLYKAYILMENDRLFAEEIYINTFIALEAMLEHIKIKKLFTKKKVLDFMEDRLETLKICVKFKAYEEHMREGIRNNIVHPFRNHAKKSIAQPFMTADDILEDLPLVDLIFKNLLSGAFY